MDINSGEVKPPQESVETPSPTRVLIAEDDPSLLKLMQMVLQRQDNLITTFCTTGEEAITLIQNAKEGESFDRIITDNGLAGSFTGFDVAAAAKNLNNPPFVILFTGSAGEILRNNSAEELKTKGIDFVAGKPLGIDQLGDLATRPIGELNQVVSSQR